MRSSLWSAIALAITSNVFAASATEDSPKEVIAKLPEISFTKQCHMQTIECDYGIGKRG
jgi:hypothetical protein